MKFRCCFLIALFTFVGLTGYPIDLKTNGWGVTVPDALRLREGNTNSFLPFLDDFGSDGDIHYQQVFAASAFTNVPAGGAYLAVIEFRANCRVRGSYSTTNLSIWFSTTQKPPDGLSSTFAENVGSDVTQVRSPGKFFGFGAEGCPEPPFEAGLGPRVDLERIFVYDPSKGNLLMEVKVQATEVPLRSFFLDAENVLGDAVSRVVGRGFNSKVADIANDTIGIPVHFELFTAPVLSFEKTTNGVKLAWLVDPIPATLQWSDSLVGGGLWTDYPGPIPPFPSVKTLEIPSSKLGTQKYFRLFSPNLPPLGNPPAGNVAPESTP